MYPFLLGAHNIFRWVVLVAGLLAVGRGFYGWFGKKEWVKQDRLIGLIFTSSVDIHVNPDLCASTICASALKGRVVKTDINKTAIMDILDLAVIIGLFRSRKGTRPFLTTFHLFHNGLTPFDLAQ